MSVKKIDSLEMRQATPVDVTSPDDGEIASCSYLLPDGNIDWVAALKANEGWMRGVIAQRVGEQEGIDEVFQEVGLAASRQQTPLRDATKVGSWLYRLAVVQSSLYRRSLGRKRKARQRYVEQVVPAEKDANQLEPLDWLLDRERNERIRLATSKLSPDEQEILRLKYAEDKSYQKIADELGITVFAVQSKLHRTRMKLKKMLQTVI